MRGGGSPLFKQCHLLFTSVHLRSLQKPWDVCQSGAERLDAELRCGPSRHEHLAMHPAGGDFYVHLTLDERGPCAREDTGDLALAVYRKIQFDVYGCTDDTGHVPCLKHTFFPSPPGCRRLLWTILLCADSTQDGTFKWRLLNSLRGTGNSCTLIIR